MRACALLLLLLAGACVASPALYANSTGTGAPFIRPDGTVDTALCRQVARFPQVSLNVTPFSDSRTDVPLLLRRFNPSIRIYWYDTLVQRFYFATAGTQWKAEWDAVSRYALYDTNGGSFPWLMASNVWIDLGRCADTLASLWVRNVWWNHLGDGVFLDFANGLVRGNSVAGYPVDFVRAGYASQVAMDTATVRGLRRFTDKLKAAGVQVLIGNGTGQVGTTHRMLEGFDNGLTSFADALTLHEGDWLKAEGGWEGAYSADALRRARLLLAVSYLSGANACFGPDRSLGVRPVYLSWWYDEWSVTNGRADTTLAASVVWLGQAGDTRQEGGAYIRWFQHGAVIVNPTADTVAINFYGNAYRRILGLRDPWTNNGQAYSIHRVPPHDALFLWRK